MTYIPSGLADTVGPKATAVAHSWTVSALGWLAIVAGIALPILTLFTQTGFVNSLLWGATADKVAAYHQLVTTLIISCSLAITGGIGLFIGKGPLSPKVTPDS